MKLDEYDIKPLDQQEKSNNSTWIVAIIALVGLSLDILGWVKILLMSV